MADTVRYERLQDLKAAISGRQGIFVYAPVAQQDRVGIVKGLDSITVNADGSLDVSAEAKFKFIQVLNNNTPADLSPYEGSLFIYQSPGYTDVLCKVVNGELISTDLDLKEVRVSKVTDAGSNVALIFTDSTISIRINDAEYIFGPTKETTVFPFHYKNSEVDALIATARDNVQNGTTIAGKAVNDSEGNPIIYTYAASINTDYVDSSNKIYIELVNKDGNPLIEREITLPKATALKDGLMSKEDKANVDNLGSTIDAKILTHSDDEYAHLFLREEIGAIQQEIDRIKTKGRSWGEIDLTFSAWLALGDPAQSTYVTNFLMTKYPEYLTPSDGDLVYTEYDELDKEHELEYNETAGKWLDNGAYVVNKANNNQYGIIIGNEYLSIVHGIVQVLKSDYAGYLGTPAENITYSEVFGALSALNSGKQDTMQAMTHTDVLTGSDTLQKTISAKELHDAIYSIMINTLGGES